MGELRGARRSVGLEDERGDVVGEGVADVAEEAEAERGGGTVDGGDWDLVVDKLGEGDVDGETAHERTIDLDETTKTSGRTHLALVLVVSEGTVGDRDVGWVVTINVFLAE